MAPMRSVSPAHRISLDCNVYNNIIVCIFFENNEAEVCMNGSSKIIFTINSSAENL
jgi:hypothetical protein